MSRYTYAASGESLGLIVEEVMAAMASDEDRRMTHLSFAAAGTPTGYKLCSMIVDYEIEPDLETTRDIVYCESRNLDDITKFLEESLIMEGNLVSHEIHHQMLITGHGGTTYICVILREYVPYIETEE
jgi:hypothetical protein